MTRLRERLAAWPRTARDADREPQTGTHPETGYVRVNNSRSPDISRLLWVNRMTRKPSPDRRG